eukprot:1376002-Pleurochrysis_carterae.AAC.1
MEVPGATTNAGALQESDKRSTRSYMAALFPANLAMLPCAGKLVRALGSALCYMLKRLANAC